MKHHSMNGRWDKWVVYLAEGFGVGRAPTAPGTFGSVVGLAWLALLLLPGRMEIFGLGCLAGVAVAVWVCGRAERVLDKHDPSSVVLDEIVAVPLCFIPMVMAQSRSGMFPGGLEFFREAPLWWVPAGFVAFRFFDILKPWPARQIQCWPGGWGIVADDVAAAAWVAVLGVWVVL